MNYMWNKKKAILISTHPRSGTHLTIDLLRRNFPELQSRKKVLEPLDALYVPVDIAIGECKKDHAKVRELISRHQYPILKTHWLQPDFSNLDSSCKDIRDWMREKLHVIYVLRHPECVIASHFLFESSHKEIRDREIWLNNAARSWVSHVSAWTNRPDTITVRFVDIVHDTRSTIDKLEVELGLAATTGGPLLPPRQKSKWVGRFYRLCCTNAPSTEILTVGQGASFDELFKGIPREKFHSVTRDLLSKYWPEKSEC